MFISLLRDCLAKLSADVSASPSILVQRISQNSIKNLN
jgi:hypothetical protein